MPLKSWADLVNDADTSNSTVSFEPLPDAIYDLKITEASHRVAQSGKDGFNITTEVENGPYAGRKVFSSFWISPDNPTALGIFFRQMAAIGLDKAFFLASPSNEQIANALVGKRLKGQVNTEEYNGKKNNRIKNVFEAGPAPLGGAVPTSAPNTVESAVASAVPSTPAVESVPTATPTAPTTPAVSESPWDGATSVPTFGGAPDAPF